MAKTTVVGVHEAKTHFSKLLKLVEAGEEVVVKSFDRPVAKLVPYSAPKAPRRPGLLAGKIVMGPDFDEIPPGFDVFGA
jgi:prevent-host-death family protein